MGMSLVAWVKTIFMTVMCETDTGELPIFLHSRLQKCIRVCRLCMRNIAHSHGHRVIDILTL